MADKSFNLVGRKLMLAIPCYDRLISEPTMMSVIKTIMYFDSNNILPITQGLREKGVTIDVSKFLGNMLVIKLVIGSMYILYTYAEYLLKI